MKGKTVRWVPNEGTEAAGRRDPARSGESLEIWTGRGFDAYMERL